MDSYREHPSDFDLPASDETQASHDDVTAAIGTDERRMHVRAYNYWVSLLGGRDFPSIEDLESADVQDFSSHSVLLDFTCGRDNPAIPYIGGEIREECGLSEDARTIADVPSRSLLSRLTDHYMQIIANRAPVGFEAEFANQRGANICYRGILMPFSSDGEEIDFIYGVINWKTVARLGAETPLAADLAEEVDAVADEVPELLLEEEHRLDASTVAAEPFEAEQAVEAEPAPEFVEHDAEPATTGFDLNAHVAWDETGDEADEEPFENASQEAQPPVHFAWQDEPPADVADDEIAELVLDEDAGLADRLWAARETAESVKAGEGRTRVSLYRALSLAYDFALAARDNAEEYAELLEESGVKAQARAPMTPIVKLVFGVDYDKARLTEFAAALSFAQRQDIAAGAFKDFIEKQPGGLKALVAAERQARRPNAAPDSKSEAARAALRAAQPISLADVPSDEEFAVVVTRRGADGRHEPIAIVDDEALLDRALRRVA